MFGNSYSVEYEYKYKVGLHIKKMGKIFLKNSNRNNSWIDFYNKTILGLNSLKIFKLFTYTSFTETNN